jgi:hypothetical protein
MRDLVRRKVEDAVAKERKRFEEEKLAIVRNIEVRNTKMAEKDLELDKWKDKFYKLENNLSNVRR